MASPSIDMARSAYDELAARLRRCGYHIAWTAATGGVTGATAIVVECWLTYELCRTPGIVLVVKYPNGSADPFASMYNDDGRTLASVLKRIGVEDA